MAKRGKHYFLRDYICLLEQKITKSIHVLVGHYLAEILRYIFVCHVNLRGLTD